MHQQASSSAALAAAAAASASSSSAEGRWSQSAPSLEKRNLGGALLPSVTSVPEIGELLGCWKEMVSSSELVLFRGLYYVP
jgi:hypothetical protein